MRFRQTIERGLGLLEERFDALDEAGREGAAGRDAFQLYDTFGFPLDLTEVICAERGFGVDDAGYEAALERSARALGVRSGEDQAVEARLPRGARQRVPGGGVTFTGYERDTATVHVVALDRGRARSSSSARSRRRGRGRDATRRRSTARPAVRSAIRARSRTPRARVLGSTDTQKPLRARRAPRHGRRRHARGRRQRSSSRSTSRAANASARNHSATHLLALGAAQGARRARAAEGLAGRSRSPALRLHARQAAHARRDRADRGARERAHARRTTRCAPRCSAWTRRASAAP